MITALDHVSIVVPDLAAGVRAYERFLGVKAELGAGRAWLSVGPIGLELSQGALGGLAGLAFAVDDLDEARRRLERRAIASTAETMDGRAVARLDAAATHGVCIDLVRARALSGAVRMDIEGLDHVVIATTDAERAVALWGGRLGLDLRLDRSNPAWGARQLFFRCGEMVVEVAARLDTAVGDGPDRLSGLAWRVRDPVAVRDRLAEAGFDVSEVRKGRKPGTAVFTLRSGLAGAPALIIGPG